MAKKKRASAPDSSSTGLKPSTSKVNTRDAAAEKPKSDLEPKLTLESSPRHPNTPPQRQKNSIASLLNDESTPKRRISARLNPDCAISYQNEDDYQPTVANGAEEQAVLTASQVKKPALRSITPELFAQAEAKKEEGNVHFKSAKFTDAIKCYSEAIALNCDNPAYLSNRAAASMALGDYRSALNDMQTVTSSKFLNLGIQPSIKNLLRLIRCLLPLGKFYAARQTLNQISKLYPDSHELKKEESRLINLEFRLNSLQQNRLDEKWNLLLLGLVALERELDCGPLKVKDWLIWRVEGLCGQKKWEDANSLCSDLVRSYPSDPEVLYHRAKVMYSQGNLTATIRHCQEAMRCDPDFTGARNLLRRAKNIESLKESGNTSFKASDFKTAIAKYLEASSIDPTNKAVVTTLDSNRAQALFKSKNNQEAIKICNKILEVDAHHFKALRTRGRAKKAESDFDGAILDFEIASKFAPSAKEGAEISSDIKATKILVSRGKYVDYYKVLEVSRNATDDEIKKGFRKKSLIHHPDKGGNEEKFKEVNEAYRVLQDPQSRRKFDLTDPDNPEGTLNNGRGAGFSNAEYAFSFDDLFTTVGGSTSSYKRTPFGRHAHAHHGYQSSSSFFPNSNAF